jgi:hypothetical protein
VKIESGKYYRMRCGGAVQIHPNCKIIPGYAENVFHAKAQNGLRMHGQVSYYVDGRCTRSKSTILDLIAEITEAEYNRIVNGEAFESAVSDERRFEAAKSAMQGLNANSLMIKGIEEMLKNNAEEFQGYEVKDIIALMAVNSADALLKALEASK